MPAPSESAVTSRHYVMPQHANPLGFVFGGQLVAWIDTVAAMAAQRHSKSTAVTAGIDSMSFHEPIHVGEIVVIEASVNYVGKTSMEVGIAVQAEDPFSGKQRKATQAYITFVAIDNKGCPIAVPELEPNTEEEKRRFNNGRIRQEHRKELLAKIRNVE